MDNETIKTVVAHLAERMKQHQPKSEKMQEAALAASEQNILALIESNRKLTEARRNAAAAQIVARAARGRFHCLCAPAMLEDTLARISPAIEIELVAWVRGERETPIWGLVFSHAADLGPDTAIERAAQCIGMQSPHEVARDVVLYAVYHRLWQLASAMEAADDPNFVDADTVEHFFGLCI